MTKLLSTQDRILKEVHMKEIQLEWSVRDYDFDYRPAAVLYML